MSELKQLILQFLLESGQRSNKECIKLSDLIAFIRSYNR
jgi:hypothetical protein